MLSRPDDTRLSSSEYLGLDMFVSETPSILCVHTSQKNNYYRSGFRFMKEIKSKWLRQLVFFVDKSATVKSSASVGFVLGKATYA